MKKIVLILAFCALCAGSFLYAQASIDPANRFYTYAQNWAVRGLIDNVPPLRPYPLSNIKQILTTVIENGTKEDAEIAKQIWEEETGRSWHLSFGADASFKLSSSDSEVSKDDFLVALVPSAFGELSLFDDFVSMGYRFSVDAFALGAKDGFHPLYTNRIYDYAEDPARIGPFTAYIDMNNALSVGTQNIFFQGGLNRRGYGSFLENGTMLNDSVVHAPNFSFTYIAPHFSYTQIISILGATANTGKTGHFAFNKYYAFHALELSLFKDRFSVAYVENTIFGERFDPSYLLPVPYMAIQTLYSAADNLQMGLVFKLKPVTGLLFSAEVYVDDVDFNSIVKLHFDTRNRFNFRAGVIYAPEKSICTLVEFDYMAIMPFMYTHWQYDTPTDGTISPNAINYSDYTHYGQCIGSSVPPNSDRVSFKINFNPVKNFNLSLWSSFTRHANVVESFTDDEAIKFLTAEAGVYATDGSIFTNSMFANPGKSNLNVIPTGHYHLNFLTQEHKMYIIQTGLDADYTLFRKKWGTLSLTFGYSLECIINKGVDTDMYPGMRGRVKPGTTDGTYKIDDGAEQSLEETVQYFKTQWENRLTDVFNHYFTIGVKYTF